MASSSPARTVSDSPLSTSAPSRSYRNQHSRSCSSGAPSSAAGTSAAGRGEGRSVSSSARPARMSSGHFPGAPTPPQTRTGVGIAAKNGLPRSSSARATSSDVPSAVSRPCSSTAARSAIGSASSSRCSERITVTPSSRLRRCTVWRNSAAAMGSSWPVGSSSTSTSGCIAITDARFSSCFCPPESVSTLRSNHVWMPKKLAISPTRSRMVCASVPRLSSPKASSCHTLSVTSWSSGCCSTKPMRCACVRASHVSSGLPSSSTRPLRVP